MDMADDAPARARLARWYIDQALPLWGDAGFDRGVGLYHEQLTFGGDAIVVPALRLMVQCRQIAVFARMTHEGLWASAEAATVAFDTIRRRYRSPDGAPGWVFSVSRDGVVADATRDLYAHAFVLYACAWMHRLTGDAAYLRDADDTLAAVDRVFGVGEGYLAARPGNPDERLQNPHMHLFEGLLALAETSGRQEHMDRCHALV
ncbi:MAG: mannose-6-phosphate isomerase, partial [Caulobacteraceae bacterium]